MPTIERIVAPGGDTTIFRVRGDVDAEQIIRAIIEFLTTAPTRFVEWNLVEGSLSKITPEGLRSIVEKAGPYAGPRAGGRTAIVCRNDVDFGLSRMFETFAELGKVPFEIRVFRDPGLALAWLEEKK